jgi:hypothetical protein
MTDDGVFQIRLSRIPLFLLFLAGAAFCLAGLDIAFFHSVFPAFQVKPGSKVVFYLFILFFAGCGGAIAVQMLLYLVLPPVMFRASVEGISFGTGFRYTLYTIPWKSVNAMGAGVDSAQLIVNKNIFAGLQVEFAHDPGLPSWLPTSIGVSYVFYTLTLSWIYMGAGLAQARQSIEILKKRYS